MSTNIFKLLKPFTLACPVLLFSVISLYAQAAPDAGEIRGLLNEFLAGAGKNDIAMHDRFWAEDLIYTRSAGTRISKDELMKNARSAPAAKSGDAVTVYSAEDVRIQQYGDAAVVAFKLIGNSIESDGSKSVSNYLNTGTFVKRNGIWQAVAWQATTVPKPVASIEPTPSKPFVEAQPVRIVATENPIAPASEKSKSADSRIYQKGTRGGCFYLNASGKKVYVDHSKCQ